MECWCQSVLIHTSKLYYQSFRKHRSNQMKLIKHQESINPSNDATLNSDILVQCSDNFSKFIYLIAAKDHAFTTAFPSLDPLYQLFTCCYTPNFISYLFLFTDYHWKSRPFITSPNNLFLHNSNRHWPHLISLTIKSVIKEQNIWPMLYDKTR